jgi:hypothetical protein
MTTERSSFSDDVSWPPCTVHSAGRIPGWAVLSTTTAAAPEFDRVHSACSADDGS